METRARILCVDDDEGVLRTITTALRGSYDVTPASNGQEALERLAAAPDTAVILSDMWMPGMDGITLLKQVQERSPDVVRVLLTGQPELQTAIDAVNQGQIFRFLSKPVPLADLRASVAAAATQYRLVTAERVLLEQTLHGSIHALIDALSLSSPLGFGRATRVKELAAALSAELALPRSWQVEVAAMLSQLATITLPPETLERLSYGRELSPEEKEMVDRLPAITEQLLGHIPRLEIVRRILRAANEVPRKPGGAADATGATVASGAQILRVALAFDLLHMQGNDPATAIGILRSRAGAYDPATLNALVQISGELVTSREILEVPLTGMRAGMVLLDNLVLSSGMLLVCAGASVTVGLLERLKNLPRGSVREPIRVHVPPVGPSGH